MLADFATIADLEARWRTLSNDEETRATALLTDASSRIRVMAAQEGVELGTDDDSVSTLKSITCSMVIRAMLNGTDGTLAPIGSSEASWTAGPFTSSATFANPTGDLYLTSAEKSLIGLGGMKLGSVRVAIHNPDGTEMDGW